MLKQSGTLALWTEDRELVIALPKDGDYEGFYNKYLVTGTSFYVTLPVITGDYTGTFTNHVAQIAFGNGYDGNTVENNIPKLETLKDAVVAIGSDESLANGIVELGQKFPYELDAPAIPTNVEGALTSYVIHDDFDEKHDHYDGEFYAFAQQDFKFKDGTVVKKGDEITRYVTQNITRDENGVIVSVDFSFNQDFLSQLQISGENVLDPVIYMMVERIAYGESIENTMTVDINGHKVARSTVVTNTPEPKPVVPTENTPIQPAAMLPVTGEQSSGAVAAIGTGLLLGLLGLAYRDTKKREK